MVSFPPQETAPTHSPTSHHSWPTGTLAAVVAAASYIIIIHKSGKTARNMGEIIFMRILFLNIHLMHENGSFQMRVRVLHLWNSQLDGGTWTKGRTRSTAGCGRRVESRNSNRERVVGCFCYPRRSLFEALKGIAIHQKVI